MIWLWIILSLILILLFWLLIASFILKIDTTQAMAELKWVSIGKIRVWYENEWWLSFRILFYQKTLRFSDIKSKPVKKKIAQKKKTKRSKRIFMIRQMKKKIVRMIKTFRIVEWKLSIDTGDNTSNAMLYPINFLPHTFEHININFNNKNYLILKIKNRPWRLVYAFLF